MRKRTRAFSMIEMVVAMAIMVIIGAALIPSIANYSRQTDLTDTFTILKTIAAAFGTPAATAKYKLSTTRYPGSLDHLTRKITLNDSTSCNGLQPGATLQKYTSITGWTEPYYPIMIPPSGLRLPIGVANDRMVRTTNSTTSGFIQIQIPNIPYDVALDLNTIIDGPADPVTSRSSTAGALRFSVPDIATELTTVTYNIPVNATC